MVVRDFVGNETSSFEQNYLRPLKLPSRSIRFTRVKDLYATIFIKEKGFSVSGD